MKEDSLGSERSSTGFQSAMDAYRKRHAAPAAVRELPGGSERVLVVDDNRILAESTRRLLAELGYEALTCSDPLHAQRIFAESSPGCFQLLLTDYSMPRMSGYRLAEVLQQCDPSLRVLLCSAWPEEVIREEHPEGRWPAFLEKPFSLETLALRVREVLDDHALALC